MGELNEAQSYRLHSNLTTKQQQEAMQSLYGLGGPMTPETMLTYEERIKMRRMLDDLDKREAGHKEFDLNKPPVEPYRYREFPYLMYDHSTRKAKAARNEAERSQMSAEGYSDEPFPADPPEIELSAAERDEAAVIDRLLVKKGKR